MYNQQGVFQRRRQRLGQRVDQLTIPIERELSRHIQYEHYQVLSSFHSPLTQAIQVMGHDVYDIDEQHCDMLEGIFGDLLLAVRGCISVLNGSVLTSAMRPYPLIMKLFSLHRMLIEAQILVENVRGQWYSGRLATDPCGSYWHLRLSVRDVVKSYRHLLSLLNQECVVSIPESA